jgi:hypothetical protein
LGPCSAAATFSHFASGPRKRIPVAAEKAHAISPKTWNRSATYDDRCRRSRRRLLQALTLLEKFDDPRRP